MLLRCALPAVRQTLAHSFPIYEMGSDLLPSNDVLRMLTIMLQAFPKQPDMILPWRKGIGRSSKLVPKLSHENELFLSRESLQFGNFFGDHLCNSALESRFAQDERGSSGLNADSGLGSAQLARLRAGRWRAGLKAWPLLRIRCSGGLAETFFPVTDLRTSPHVVFSLEMETAVVAEPALSDSRMGVLGTEARRRRVACDNSGHRSRHPPRRASFASTEILTVDCSHGAVRCSAGRATGA